MFFHCLILIYLFALSNVDYIETYKAMEDLVDLGWVRSLGLSNFNCSQMQRVLECCRIKPVTNQIECHPALQQSKQRIFCQKHSIVLTAYSPLARPKPSKPMPEFYLSAEIEQLCEKYHKTKAQIVLRYLVSVKY